MSEQLDSTNYPAGCGACLHPHWRPTAQAEDRRLFCCHLEFAQWQNGQREIPVGTERSPAWCPCGLGTDVVEERARLIELGAVPSDEKPEDISESDSLALIMYMLFGPNAGEEIKDGGYIRYFVGGTAPGILEQIDKRLVRLEEKLGLVPIEFVVGDEEDEVEGGSPA